MSLKRVTDSFYYINALTDTSIISKNVLNSKQIVGFWPFGMLLIHKIMK